MSGRKKLKKALNLKESPYKSKDNLPKQDHVSSLVMIALYCHAGERGLGIYQLLYVGRFFRNKARIEQSCHRREKGKMCEMTAKYMKKWFGRRATPSCTIYHLLPVARSQID